MIYRIFSASALCLALAFPARGLEWERIVLNEKSNFESAGVADFNKDGRLDVMCGDTWYSAPDWKAHKVCAIEEKDGYRVDFANIPMDVNGDGWMDIVSCNWHETSVKWRENPGAGGGDWKEHLVDKPGNMETAIAVDVDGDGTLDFLPDVAQKTVWYRLENGKLVARIIGPQASGHGIGFGDINGDGRPDIPKSTGWLEAPADRLSAPWTWHPEPWNLGGASISIVVHDFNGDGLADIFWCNGHDYGTFWIEQTKDADPAKRWVRHEIDKDWSQGHAVALVDLDGDGKKDILTGKRKYAHTTDPGAEDEMVVFAYFYDAGTKSFRRETIHRGGGDGLGLAPAVVDIDGDGDLDIVAPGKTGLYLYRQKRTKGATAPQKARSMLQVPEGFEVTLFASEPEIRKPIAFCFDEKGRLIVAEAAEYPLGPKPGERPKDTVKILEDIDRDGRADKITVFADGLKIPDAVAAGHGGIYIAEAPNLWFMRDTDGDGRADERRAILTNFGQQDSHHLVHGLQWGPEGKLLMSQGCSTTSTIQADGKTWELKEGDFFRCWSDGSGFEIPFKSFTNSWGYDWDGFGHWIANDNEGPHLIHLVEGGDYGLALTRRHAGAPGTLPGIETAYGGARGYLVQSGLTVYSGDAFPEDFENNVLQGSPNLHRVIRDSLEPKGASFLAHKEEDLTESADDWHRPIALTVGPDGAVYMLDWYNEILAHVEHPLDSPRRDKSRGRIYRIAWKEAPKSAIPDLTKATTAELATNLRLNNRWIRRTSQRLLAAKKADALGLVFALLNAKETARTKCHAIWTLEETRLAEIPEHKAEIFKAVEAALDDPSPSVRETALRTARHIGLAGANYRMKAVALAADPNDFVRFEAAMAIASIAERPKLAEVTGLIAGADWTDPFLAFAFGKALEGYKEELVMHGMEIGAQGLAQDPGLLPALFQIRDPRTEPLLIALLRVPDLKPHVAEEAVAGLRGFESSAVEHALASFLAEHPDLPPHLVRPILDDLRRRPAGKRNGSEADIDRVLIRLAESGNQALLRDVFMTAAHVGDADLTPRMIASFNHPDARTAEAAILGCGDLGAGNAEASLRGLVNGADGRRKWALIRALSKIGGDPLLEAVFLDGLADPDTARDSLAGLRRLEATRNDGKTLDRVMDREGAGKVVLSRGVNEALRGWIASEKDEARRKEFQSRLAQREGILRDWRIIGPFPNIDTKGHAEVYPPERELKADISYEAMGKQISWQSRRSEDPHGMIGLMDLMPNERVVAYGWATFNSDTEGAATLLAGSDDSIKIWLNGEVVLDHLVDRGLALDQDQAPIHLKKGENTVLLKCGQNAGGWNFHARIERLPAEVERDPKNLEARALYTPGDAGRGENVFFSGAVGCARCHAVEGKGGRVGPDLTRIAHGNPKKYLVRSILEPSEEIADGFGGVSLTLEGNDSLEGYILRESPSDLTFVTAEGKSLTIAKSRIKERRQHQTSGMPEDLEQSISPQEFVDLVAYLEERM